MNVSGDTGVSQVNARSVYCIIVTYNGLKWINRCLSSLEESNLKVNTIVIDNASTDQTVSYIRTNFPAVQLIESKKNLGFGQGNNLGLQIAIENKADYVFLLNQDAYVEADTIDRLISLQSRHPEYGILSPIHLNGSGDDFDDHFFEFLTKSDIRAIVWNHLFNRQLDHQIIETPFVNAAAWLISSACLMECGGFDPIFFHYGEDDNYAQRVRHRGFKIGIVTWSRIYHDKERPALQQKKDLRKIINRDWTQFLVYACDINSAGYRPLMLKSGFRHLLRFIIAGCSIDRDQMRYHGRMAANIFSSFSRVANSRQKSLSKRSTPHLQ